MGILRRVHLKTDSEIELIKKSSLLVGKTLGEVAKLMKPGVPLYYIDRVAEEFIRDNHGIPSCKGYCPARGYVPYPATLCLSVNDVIVHGIPNDYVLREGDIVTADCVASVDGWHGDYAYTFAIGDVSEEKRLLMERTKASLYEALKFAVTGKRIGDISHAVECSVKPYNYGIIRELCGHGIGRSMHEAPDVPNYGPAGQGETIRPGMVFCVEPMIAAGTHKIREDKDGWTIRTADGKPAAHYEHQVVINSKGQTEVISTYKYIEEALGINTND